MAKQTHKLKENIRNINLQMKDLAGKHDELDKRLVAIATIIRRCGFEDLLADVPQSAASIGRANLALDQHFDAIPGTLQPVVEIIEQAKPIESRNTPKKKHNKQQWSAVVVSIRAECDVAVDELTEHRVNDPCRNQNWATIARAAKTVVINDDSKQDLPLVGLIFVYASRLRLKVLERAQNELIESKAFGSYERSEHYQYCAASLLAVLHEIKAGPKFKINQLW